MAEANEQLISHPNESIKKYGELLKRVVQADLPLLNQEAQHMPKGFQYVVEAPWIPMQNNPSEIQQTSGEDLAVAEAFYPNTEDWVGQSLGILNVTGVHGGEVEFDYHSTSGGNDFHAKIGNEVTFDGASPEIITQAIAALLKTLPNRKTYNLDANRRLIHLGATRNREHFDREGNWIKRKEQVSSSLQKELSPSK